MEPWPLTPFSLLGSRLLALAAPRRETLEISELQILAVCVNLLRQTFPETKPSTFFGVRRRGMVHESADGRSRWEIQVGALAVGDVLLDVDGQETNWNGIQDKTNQSKGRICQPFFFQDDRSSQEPTENIDLIVQAFLTPTGAGAKNRPARHALLREMTAMATQCRLDHGLAMGSDHSVPATRHRF